MSTERIEYYLSRILTSYELPDGETKWLSHDKVGPDDMVHYFERSEQKYVLVWSDFPNSTFIHEEGLEPVQVRGGKDEWYHVREGCVAGYYSLYKDY